MRIPREVAGFRLLRKMLTRRGVPQLEAEQFARDAVAGYRYTKRRWPEKAERFFSAAQADKYASLYQRQKDGTEIRAVCDRV